MKKLIITLALILPLFLSSNLFAQSGPTQQNFYVYAIVSAPAQCPTSGDVIGHIPDITDTQTEYNGPNSNGGTMYYLLWNGGFSSNQKKPVTVSVNTDTNSSGISCFDEQTKELFGNQYGERFYLDLIPQTSPPGGGNNN